MSLREDIFRTERDIMKIKSRHALGIVSYDNAKNRLIGLNAQLEMLVSQLSPEEREMYKFKKENFF